MQDGTKISYRLWRQGAVRPLMVLLHGVASNLTRWSEFTKHTRLRDTWDILRLDLRGHGTSPYRGRLELERWGLDVTTVIKAEGYNQAVILGHSLGAQIALRMAAGHPELVRGLVLIDPVFPVALKGTLRLMSRFSPLFKLLIKLVCLLNALGIRRRHIPLRDLRTLDEKTRTEFLHQGKKQEMIERYSSVLADLKYFPTAHYLQEILEMVRPPPDLSRIHVPVLVLLSTGITYTDPVLTHQILARHANIKTVNIEAHHWPLTEKPADVRHAIEAWIDAQFKDKV